MRKEVLSVASMRNVCAEQSDGSSSAKAALHKGSGQHSYAEHATLRRVSMGVCKEHTMVKESTVHSHHRNMATGLPVIWSTITGVGNADSR